MQGGECSALTILRTYSVDGIATVLSSREDVVPHGAHYRLMAAKKL